jgi:5-methylcytosine-specific restriction protein A
MPSKIKQHRPSLPKMKPDRIKCPERTLKLNSAAWQRLRRLVLSEQPLCPLCRAAGEYVASTDVHHVDDDASNNLRSNLVGWCHSCHSKETRRNQLRARRGG